ncbi:Hypothetical predicted protein [Lecanosticta acicola]|uniref:Uncharacterized protein n=1 Tax=Lecanosticta acicola TaxID=111012 RepID=A0AAI9ECE7_9PEZI|nr:Hypothetical predicted protein [Lecanosticta acicola]
MQDLVSVPDLQLQDIAETGNVAVVSFETGHLFSVIRRDISWNTSQVEIWLATYALQFLRVWYRAVYDNPVLRRELLGVAYTGGLGSIYNQVRDLCYKYKAHIRKEEVFNSIVAPTAIKMTADAAVCINGASFQEISWISAFQMDDKPGLCIATSLLVAVFNELTYRGSSSLFLPLLVEGSVVNPQVHIVENWGKDSSRWQPNARKRMRNASQTSSSIINADGEAANGNATGVVEDERVVEP